MQKLVRDRIPELMASAGLSPTVRILHPTEHLEWLLAKLGEETAELAETPNLEECADVLEVVASIAKLLGFTFGDVFQAALAKKKEKGGFDAGLVISIDESAK